MAVLFRNLGHYWDKGCLNGGLGKGRLQLGRIGPKYKS